MKSLIFSFFAAAACLSFSACTTVEDSDGPAVHSTTTTTEESTVRHPVSTTRETQTIRQY
jgi:hypothetical protein